MQSSPLPRRIRHGVLLSTAALLATTSSLSWAHAGLDGGAHHGFAAGLMHPITGPDHLAAMLAVGIWSALATRRLWLAPLSFAALLLIGALAGQWGLVLPGVEPMIAASLLIMGLLIVGRTHLPEWSGAVLVGVFAMFHGAAHGQELDGHWALAGMVISTAVLHGLGIAIGAGLRRTPAWLSTTAGMAVSGLGLLMTAKLMTA